MRKYLTAICSALSILYGIIFVEQSVFANAFEEALLISSLLSGEQPKTSRPAAASGREERKKSWYEFIKWYGDFRYRWETLDEEDQETRHRNRIRARFGIKAELHDSFLADFRLASGSEDPVSANQTLGQGFATKQINLDLAYFDWHPAEVQGLHAIMGIQKSPFYRPAKTEMLWDSDLTPGGMAAKFSREAGSAELFGVISGFWADERKNDPSALMYGFQGGGKFGIPGTKMFFLGGISYYYYTNLKDFPVLFRPEAGKGNSTYEDENGVSRYLYDYSLFEAFGEAGAAVFNRPIVFLFDYVMNTAADVEEGRGWLLGFQFGETKKPGSWKVSYDYRDLEKDAVLGLTTESDFGIGNTDVKGHKFGFNVRISKYVWGRIAYFNNTLYPDSDDEKHFQRFQADINVRF